MASISRPVKNVVPTLPIVAKRIGGGGTSAFSEGVPAAVGPRALSPRESRGEVHRQRRTQAGQRLPNDVLTKENRYAWFTHAREDASKGVQGAGVRRGGYIYIYTYWWKAVGEAIEGKGERRATLLPSCSLLPRTKGTERELYARSTHVILYKRTRRGILTMLPPRSLDQSCPESHARCEPSWLSSSSQFFPCLHQFISIFASLYFRSVVSFSPYDISGIYANSCNTSGGERREGGRGGEGSEGFHRMRRRRLAKMLTPVRDRRWSPAFVISILRTDVSIHPRRIEVYIISVPVFIVVTAYVREAVGWCQFLRRSCKASLTGRTSCGISIILVTGKEIFKFIEIDGWYDMRLFDSFHNDGPMIFFLWFQINTIFDNLCIYIYLFYEKFLSYFYIEKVSKLIINIQNWYSV